MLASFLKEAYKSKALKISKFEGQLLKWNISQDSLSRKFVFNSFQEAIRFFSIADKYLNGKGIHFNM